jgi:hypothetical protein
MAHRFLHHSTLGTRVMKKKKGRGTLRQCISLRGLHAPQISLQMSLRDICGQEDRCSLRTPSALPPSLGPEPLEPAFL